MSNQPRGRGAGGASGRGGRGRGDFSGGSRGDFSGGSRGRGDFQAGRGRGDSRGGFTGRGGRGRGGMQLPFRDQQQGFGPGMNPGIYLEDAPVPQPDAVVTDAENARVVQTRGKIIDGYPGRPGYGTQGRKVILRANYFHLHIASDTKQPQIALHRYAVSHSPDDLSMAKKRRLLEMIVQSGPFKGCASDYSSTIVSARKIDLGPSGVYEGRIELVDAGQPPYPPPQASDTASMNDARRRRTKRFKVELTGVFNPQDLVESLRAIAPGAHFTAGADVVQLLNIIISRAPSMAPNVYTFGKNKFYPDGHTLTESQHLGEGLRAVRGYYSSVRTATHRILVNLNVSSAAFYKAIPLKNIMNEFVGNDAVPRNPNHLERLEMFLRMLKVQTNYLKIKDNRGQLVTTRKNKTIIGFARHPRFGNAKQVSFRIQDDKGARDVSVYDYFKQHHGLVLKYWEEPVLNTGTLKDPSYLPCELATVLPGQAVKRLLSGPQTAEMIRFAARAPNLNAMSIAGTPADPGNGLTVMGLQIATQTDTVQQFGIRVNTSMVTVPGRILDCPKLQYLGYELQPKFGSWNAAERKFSEPGSFKKWSCMIINYNMHGGNALLPAKANIQGLSVLGRDELLQSFDDHLKAYGLRMGERLPPVEMNIPSPSLNTRTSIDKYLEANFKSAASFGIEIVLVILREADKWLYSRIKYWGDVKYGVQTVNAVGSKLQKPKNQGMYFGNLSLKFNIKGGGVSHRIADSAMSPLDSRTMLVGIDVTHPSPGSADGSPSIAGVVASTDSKLCQWPGSLRTQTGRQEMVEGLAEMMIERLDLWVKHNKQLPSKIIVYRDGVSEGQYRLILETELPGIQEAFKVKYGDKPKWPKVTILVVGKRHHTRFYPTSSRDADTRSYNPLPGTVVDRGVTSHFLWDFYLQAHQGLQGTARPAHYVVIMDEIGFQQDQLEKFTHNMCYLFNRATKAVSICPPAYYADLICDRGRAYLYSTLNENQSAGAAAYSATTSEWTRGVHPRLQDKTFYV